MSADHVSAAENARPEAEHGSIVVFRVGSLGDTVAALPCFHAIARRFPACRRMVLTNAPVAANAPALLSVLGDQGLVHGAIDYPVGGGSIDALLRLRRQLRDIGAETLVYLAPTRSLAAVFRDWLFFKSCGFRKILGTPWFRDLRHCRLDPETGSVEREASRLARTLASDLGPIDLTDPGNWDIQSTEDERAVAIRELASLNKAPFMAINMGGKVLANDWGPENWNKLLSSLSAERPDLGLAVLGAEADRERAERVANVWAGPFTNLCGRLNPRESAAMLSYASVFIGHDSGPMHLSAAMMTPTIGLFGNNNPPEKWHPVGTHVTAIHNMDGVQEITVSEVAGAARNMLLDMNRGDQRGPQS